MSGHGSTGGLLTVVCILCYFMFNTQVMILLKRVCSLHSNVLVGGITRTIVNEENAFVGGGWDIGG